MPNTRAARSEHKCSICGDKYTGFGNNAQPVNDGRCCDICNDVVVIPARIWRFEIAQYLKQ